MSLKELKEIVDREKYEQVIMNQMSYSQKQNPKLKPTHYSITPKVNGFDEVNYYRKKL